MPELPDPSAAAGRHSVAGLAEVLNQLGEELREAGAAGEDTIIFQSAEVTLDVAVEANATGGVKFWVVNGDAGAKYTRTATIKVFLAAKNAFGVGM